MRKLLIIVTMLLSIVCFHSVAMAGCKQSDLTGSWSMYEDHGSDGSTWCKLTIGATGTLKTGTACYSYFNGFQTAYSVTGGNIKIGSGCGLSGSIIIKDKDGYQETFTIKRANITPDKNQIASFCSTSFTDGDFFLIQLLKNP